MFEEETDQPATHAVLAVSGFAAFGALLVGATVGAPGFLIGAVAGALVGWLAWT